MTAIIPFLELLLWKQTTTLTVKSTQNLPDSTVQYILDCLSEVNGHNVPTNFSQCLLHCDNIDSYDVNGDHESFRIELSSPSSPTRLCTKSSQCMLIKISCNDLSAKGMPIVGGITYHMCKNDYIIFDSKNWLDFHDCDEYIQSYILVPITNATIHKIFKHEPTYNAYDEQVRVSLLNRLLHQCFYVFSLNIFYVIKHLVDVLKQDNKPLSSKPHPDVYSLSLKLEDFPKSTYIPGGITNSYNSLFVHLDLFEVDEGYVKLHMKYSEYLQSRNMKDVTSLEAIDVIYLLHNGIYQMRSSDFLIILSNTTIDELYIIDSDNPLILFIFPPSSTLMVRIDNERQLFIFNRNRQCSPLPLYKYI